mgnify:CR=1 FL=1
MLLLKLYAGWIQARFCTATFKPSNIVIAGEITYVYVMARDPQGNSVSYTTQAVNFSVTPLPVGIALPKSVNTELYNASQGLYVANFSIKTTGTYMVEITAYGSHINGSFYVIEVVPGTALINTSHFLLVHRNIIINQAHRHEHLQLILNEYM